MSKGCERDTDGDGNCPIHPGGCPPFTVGDVVVGANGFFLRCGSGVYGDAIIVSIDPLVAISREGDMLWRDTISEKFLHVVGKASAQDAYFAFKRWFDDTWQNRIRTQTVLQLTDWVG